MARFQMDSTEVERLFDAVKNFPDMAEQTIDDVFQNFAAPLVAEEILRLTPVSGKTWKGKAPAAKTAKSSVKKRDEKENQKLTFTVGTTAKYHYLYFPDDGTNTRRHVGNQQFFEKGGKNKQTEIVDRCIERLVTDFEKST